MRRYRIDVSYDGSQYAGWQIQPDAVTVQQRIEKTINKLTTESPRIHGSGRTDQGVHARNQVAHFDLEKKVSVTTIKRGLNALLPDDIRILRASLVDSAFHARRSAISKQYRYFIWNTPLMPPFKRHYSVHAKTRLDVNAMSEAAAMLQGEHDFSSFTANSRKEIDSTVRNLKELSVRKSGSEIMIIATANGFLYKMVRSLAGFLIRVGEGSIPPEQTKTILQSLRRTAHVKTAPAHGLFLWDVTY